MSIPVIHNFDKQPDEIRSLKSYERMASEYDSTCTRIEALRLRAVEALALQSGETVLDVACGTGSALPLLAEKVGSHGRVIGIEHSPDMAQQASARIKSSGTHASVAVAGMADPVHVYAADAVLMCYTQDVLQSPDALDQLLKACKPGARIVILGMQTLPWTWGWPVNLFNMYRARNYMTTYNNLDRPYRLLEQRGAQVSVICTALWGSAYIVAGRLTQFTPNHQKINSL